MSTEKSKRIRVLLVALIVSGTSAAVQPAYAGGFVDCRKYDWNTAIPEHDPYDFHRYYLYLYTLTLVSSEPVFNVSDSRVVINSTSSPVTATFTSSKSQTFSISVAASLSAKIHDWFTVTVSSTIQQSRTTSIGTSYSEVVPPNTTAQGDYGVEAYNVTYDVHLTKYDSFFSWPLCLDYDTVRQTTNAPTNIEGWRVTLH